MMIQITRSGTRVSGSPTDLDRMRDEFHRRHCIRLSQVLEPELLRIIQRRIHAARFYEKNHNGIGLESCMRHNTTTELLHFLVNDPRLFQIIQQITGCALIGCFSGRVYHVVPGRGHHDSWHTDMVQRRMIAMSINLSAESYRGGVLQIRERESKRMIHEVANIGLGDAIIFRIASHLEHRIADVEGAVAKTAFAGWFRSQPNYRALLKKRLSPPNRGQNGEQKVRAGRRTLAVRRQPAAMASVSLDHRVKIREEVLCRKLGEKTVLFNPDSGCHYGLDPVGSRVWTLLAEQGSLRAALESLAEEYEVALDNLRRDTLGLIQKLQANGLVVVG